MQSQSTQASRSSHRAVTWSFHVSPSACLPGSAHHRSALSVTDLHWCFGCAWAKPCAFVFLFLARFAQCDMPRWCRRQGLAPSGERLDSVWSQNTNYISFPLKMLLHFFKREREGGVLPCGLAHSSNVHHARAGQAEVRSWELSPRSGLSLVASQGVPSRRLQWRVEPVPTQASDGSGQPKWCQVPSPAC